MNVSPIFATFLATDMLDVPTHAMSNWYNDQTANDSKVPLDLSQPEFAELFAAVQDRFNKIASDILCVDNVKLFEAWVNTGDNERTSLCHTHPTSTVVGVYYPYVEGDVGRLELTSPVSALEFALPTSLSGYNVFNSNVWQVEPVTGLLVMFPSWVQHVVRASAPTATRVSIALNGRIE